MKYAAESNRQETALNPNREITAAFGINSAVGNALPNRLEAFHLIAPNLFTSSEGARELRNSLDNTIELITSQSPEELLSSFKEVNAAIAASLELDDSTMSGEEKAQALLSLKQMDAMANDPKALEIFGNLRDSMMAEARKLPVNKGKLSAQSDSKLSFGSQVAVTEQGMRMAVPNQKDGAPDSLHTDITFLNVLKSFVNPMPQYSEKEVQALPKPTKLEVESNMVKAWGLKGAAIGAYVLSTIWLSQGLGTYMGTGNIENAALQVGAGGVAFVGGVVWQLAERALMMDDDENRSDGLKWLLGGLLIADAATILIGMKGHHEIISLYGKLVEGTFLSPADTITAGILLFVKTVAATLGSVGAELLDKRSHELGDEIYKILHNIRRGNTTAVTPQQPARPVMPTPPNAPPVGGQSFRPSYPPAGGPTAPKPPGL